jgi:transcriptional regulator with XRE-family HTH domain
MKIERRADDGRWESKFGRFVSKVGAENLADQLGVDRTAVYHWVRGKTPPAPSSAVEIRLLAREQGFRISFDDIYANFSRRVSVPGAERRRLNGTNRPTGNSVRASG